MPDLLIDREREAAELRALADAGSPKLALLYGRRRVGKTYLLTQLWDSRRAFYFTASATPPAINRRVLIEEAARWTGENLRPEDHPTWRTVFRTLLESKPDHDIVVILDEFQYLATDDVGLREVTSELNAVWESPPRRRGGLLLVLSGSSVRTLEALASGGAPLYGRLNWRRRLLPFDYYDAGTMVEGYDPLDRLRVYAAFGGVPKYLQPVEPARPLADNIIDLLMAPDGEVRIQLETALSQEEGLREHATYQGILGAVGIKRRTLGEIAATLARSVDTPLRWLVGQLLEIGFLEEARDFGEPSNRALRYRIADPALRFYYGMVLPNESAIAASGAATVWLERLAAQVFPSYVGQHVFEDVVAQAWRRWRIDWGLPAVESWGRWAGRDRHGHDLEIDVVAQLLDGRMLTGSAKIRARKADAGVLREHLDALERLRASGRAWAREALEPASPLLFVSASGFARSFHEALGDLGREAITWSLPELYESPGADEDDS